MNKSEIGLLLARARKQAGLTQAQVAAKMGTTQSAIARAEAGTVLPTLGFLQRFSSATGQALTIELKPRRTDSTRTQKRKRTRRVADGFVFNPWDRDPTEAEAKSLNADGLTRERFARRRSSPTVTLSQQ
jgi:transcriptional regulator with XRE-family HTH domain